MPLTPLSYISGWINGFDRNWWSEKHNTHHVLTNHAQDDPDIHVQVGIFGWTNENPVDFSYHFAPHSATAVPVGAAQIG